jgi:hypothetical protein
MEKSFTGATKFYSLATTVHELVLREIKFEDVHQTRSGQIFIVERFEGMLESHFLTHRTRSRLNPISDDVRAQAPLHNKRLMCERRKLRESHVT